MARIELMLELLDCERCSNLPMAVELRTFTGYNLVLLTSKFYFTLLCLDRVSLNFSFTLYLFI